MSQLFAVRVYNKYLHYRDLIWSFVMRDIQARYKGTVMGVFWSVLHPLAAFSVYLLVFGFFLKVRMPQSASVLDFALYFSAGYFPWVFFSSAVSRGATCILDNRNYIKKVAFPSEVFPYIVLLSEAATLLISVGIIILFSIYVKGFSWFLLLLPVIMIIQAVFTLACIFVVSCVTVFFRDIPQLLNSVFMVWFWLTPIAYAVDLIPKKLHFFVYINPMHHVLALYRSILFNGTMVNMLALTLFTLFSLASLFLALAIFRKSKGHFSDLL